MGIAHITWQSLEVRENIIGILGAAVYSVKGKQGFREKAPVERRYLTFIVLDSMVALPHLLQPNPIEICVLSAGAVSPESQDTNYTGGYD